MRGDRPYTERLITIKAEFTPHARGSTRCLFQCLLVVCSLPRMRGDRPFLIFLRSFFILFTPHARGSTLHRNGDILRRGVYPACAGIDLIFFASFPPCGRLPRMRGDRPTARCKPPALSSFTPHARGSTLL